MAFIRLDRLGMSMMLKSAPVRAEISSIAQAVGDAARSDDPVVRHAAEIKVEDYTTDRAASAVLIKHPIGMGIQAKYGTLTRAASSQGLQVRSKS